MQSVDILIIGGGGAGLRAAIEAAKSTLNVVIISKEAFGHAHTEKAMGGINVAIKAPATPEQHFQDTLKGGWHIGNQKLVDIFTREMPDRIHDLVSYGVNFDRLPDGSFYTWAGGKQSAPLNLCAGDYTGREMMHGLVTETQQRGVTFIADHYVTKLFASHRHIQGALALNLKTGSLVFFQAKAIILAAGGGGQLYKITSNEPSNTAEGYAFAYDLGAPLVDMEFVQFHPTGMAYPESVRGSLITEKVRGHKGKLLNTKGERFMKRYQPERMELAGRDEVARAIYTEVKEGRGTKHGGVYLDVRELGKKDILKLIPDVYEKFKSVGVDISREMMEITPTMHHMMGGVKINEWGQTPIAGFFAVGEVTCSIHGANRLGGNSLGEGQVFGRRAGMKVAVFAKTARQSAVSKKDVAAEVDRITSFKKRAKGIPFRDIRKILKKTMWDNCGIVRKKAQMERALMDIVALESRIDEMKAKDILDLQGCLETVEMLKVAQLITTAALMRTESRGAHFREDYPEMKADWEKNILLVKKNGDIHKEVVPTIKRS
ncbi:FAD-dependent oxidoreductase [Candidatus Gottesmanbacteria bacterium]|nr:FAD-dependent oxidoreductase [Candidatus Gottesmanbacteria bacterium]